MNIKAYIESGILELYALNLLDEAEKSSVDELLAVHEELGEELERIYITLEQHALSHTVTPRPELRDEILDSIENLIKEKIMDPNDLPLINQNSDYKNWLKLIADFDELTPGENGKAVKVLRNDGQVTQLLISSTTAIEQEIHQDEYESFLILSGACKCTVGNEERFMTAGDFMAVPLYQSHDVQLLSPKVTAILQLVKV